MRYATKLSVLVISLCGLTILAASLAVWSAREGQWLLVRSDLAHRSFESYLSLAGYLRSARMDHDGSVPPTLRRDATHLPERIAEQLRDLRAVHKAEYDWVGASVEHELAELARLERAFDEMFGHGVSTQGSKVPLESAASAPSERAERMDASRLEALITEALARESRELEEARERARQQSATWQWLAMCGAACALLGSVLAYRWMVRDFRAPVARLVEEADRVARGQWQEPVVISSNNELDRVAQAFNHMAAEIRVRQHSLESSNRALGAAVAERTAELEDLLQSLRQGEAQRRQLLADVSHELRTPLTIIKGEADVALRGGDKPVLEYREALERSREAASHMARLVDDLLFIARHEARELVLEREAVDLAALVTATVDTSRQVLGATRAEISIDEAAGPARIEADPIRLRQVLLILLDNASRYGAQHVLVSLKPQGRGYQLMVEDDGPGLSAEEIPKVFARFYRGGDAARRYAAGAGLGLPMAKAIIEAHAGAIALESSPGKGLTVVLTLPASPGGDPVS